MTNTQDDVSQSKLKTTLTKMLEQVADWNEKDLVIICHPTKFKAVSQCQLGCDISVNDVCPIDSIYVLNRDLITIDKGDKIW